MLTNLTLLLIKNAISWFEIPATDLDRATKFYENIFGISLFSMDTPNLTMRLFPLENPGAGIGGAIVLAKDFYKPSSSEGTLLYLNANPEGRSFSIE